MTSTVATVLGSLLLLASIQAQDKWVWNGKTAKAVRDENGRVRYGLYDPEGGLDSGGGPRRDPYRPGAGLRPPPPDLPPLVRPQEYPRPPPPASGEREYSRPPPLPVYPRPGGSEYPLYPRPEGGNRDYPRPDGGNRDYPRPDGGNRGYPRPPKGLPPTPAAGKVDPDPTRFEKCKCVHAFNCKSPGLLFGSCDAGKKYCCEKSVYGNVNKGFVPDNRDPEVLAGPGGPVDHLKQPNKGIPGAYGAQQRPGGNYGFRPDGSLGVDQPYRPSSLF